MLKKLIILTAVLFLFPSCDSGGGGGSGSTGAALISITATPRQLDTGDQIAIIIFVSNVHESGIVLKIRYPEEFSYVSESATLMVGGGEMGLTPDFEGSSDDDTGEVFLIFYLDQSLFDDVSGELFFELRANSSLRQGSIEVDADIDTGELFTPEEPAFTAKDAVQVNIQREE